MDASVLCHGGALSRREDEDGCQKAALAGLRALSSGVSALDAAVEAAVVLEDDPRYNAGTGAVLRLDGRTIEMDAAVMDSSGRIGAVAAIRSVRNPVRVARQVARTPHVLLAGEGALLFAERCGLREEVAPTREAVRRHERMREAFGRGELQSTRWSAQGLKDAWNFPTALEDDLGCDTIGAVVRDGRGEFAVANSTGGTSWMLLGRVGDSPLPGCGYWAGPAGAVAATGTGEEIIRRMLCRVVYEWIASGSEPQQACTRAVALFPASVPVGLIALSGSGSGWASNRDMAVGMAERLP